MPREPVLSLHTLLTWHFEHSHLGMAVHRQGRLFKANEAYVRLFGYSIEQLAHLSCQDLTHPDDLQTSLEQIDRIRRGEISSFVEEKRYIRADGSVFYARTGVVGGYDPQDGAYCSILTIEDVTARIRAEGLLRHVVEGVCTATGESFFSDLVYALVRNTSADNVMIGECLDDGSIRAIATCGDDLRTGIEYHPKLSPCGRALREGEVIILDDFQSHLPTSAPLHGSPIDVYVGLVLPDSLGREIGLLAIFNRKPLGELEEILPILRIFASRAAGELDRIRTERARTQSEEKYRTVFDGVRVCITEHEVTRVMNEFHRLREDGVEDLWEYLQDHPERLEELLHAIDTVDANPHAVRMFGAKSKEDLITNYAAVYKPESRGGLTEFLDSLFRGQRVWEGENVYYAFDGRRIDALVRLIYVGSEEGPHTVFASRMDITELKRIERKIRSSERMLARSQALAAIGSFEWIAKEDSLVWSEELCVIFGRRREELSGTFGDFRDALHPDDREAVLETLGSVLRGGPATEVEERVIRPDGETRVLVSQVEAIRDASGVTGIRGICRDVTEERQNEEDRERLERQVLHVQKLEGLGVLAGGIAHDFNNLLTGILANAELLKLDVAADSPVRERVQDITQGALSAADLCNQMLAYAGQGGFEKRSIDLNGVVAEISHLLEVALPKKASFERDLAESPLLIHADAAQIRQVVMNLVTNAAESIGDHPGMVRLHTSMVELSGPSVDEAVVPADPPPGHYVCLEVADTGSGMDAETQAKMFDPFFSTKFTGRGLGLATVFGIVRDHLGSIMISSTPGEGTRMRVFLPPTDSPRQAELNSEAHPGSWKSGGWALLADDEPSVRSVVRSILMNSGFRVLEASNGRECLSLWQRYGMGIRVILLDVTMAHLGGMEVLKEIRSHDTEVPVVVMSGYIEPEHQLDPEDLQTRFLRKPFQLETFRGLISDVLSKTEH